MKEIIKKLVPQFVLSWYHLSLAFLGAVIYSFPSKKIKVIGVTGTNGKTTTVNLTARVLEEAGFKVAALSSIKFKINSKEKENVLRMTMPGRFKIQKFLREAVAAGCQYAVLEVSSEGIKQHRHKFIDFDAAVFTNLTPEHIEAHKGFENYKRAKGELFKAAKEIHIINADDKSAEYFLSFPSKGKFLYGLNESTRENFVLAQNIETNDSGISFEVRGVLFNLKLLGAFNIYNSLAAICVGLWQGVDFETSSRALAKANLIPGRMEEVISSPFKVFVDYAFTPAALEKVYQSLKPKEGKMIAVLGACGGGRDKWKRPVLGEIAARFCDEIIITNEDPYDEEPEKIMEEVADGVKNYKLQTTNYKLIVDRREAIREAMKLAEPNDVVVITGKGCEPWIFVKGGKKIPWDDRQIVREEFTRLN